MNSIFDLTLEELESILVENGFKKFNATQVFEGIYKKRVTSFDEITNISKELKAFLNNNYELKYFQVLQVLNQIYYSFVSTAFILLTPALDASSLIILKCPNSLVFLTCGPPHNSLDTFPIL